MIVILFLYNLYINDFNHGDLHNYNWKITEDNKIVIYDYGFCFNIDSDEYKNIDRLVTIDNKADIIEPFIKYNNGPTINYSLNSRKVFGNGDKWLNSIYYNISSKFKGTQKIGHMIYIIDDTCLNSNWDLNNGLPLVLNKTALLEVVP